MENRVDTPDDTSRGNLRCQKRGSVHGASEENEHPILLLVAVNYDLEKVSSLPRMTNVDAPLVFLAFLDVTSGLLVFASHRCPISASNPVFMIGTSRGP